MCIRIDVTYYTNGKMKVSIENGAFEGNFTYVIEMGQARKENVTNMLKSGNHLVKNDEGGAYEAGKDGRFPLCFAQLFPAAG